MGIFFYHQVYQRIKNNFPYFSIQFFGPIFNHNIVQILSGQNLTQHNHDPDSLSHYCFTLMDCQKTSFLSILISICLSLMKYLNRKLINFVYVYCVTKYMWEASLLWLLRENKESTQTILWPQDFFDIHRFLFLFPPHYLEVQWCLTTLCQ